jgi:hypothetical protein
VDARTASVTDVGSSSRFGSRIPIVNDRDGARCEFIRNKFGEINEPERAECIGVLAGEMTTSHNIEGLRGKDWIGVMSMEGGAGGAASEFN